MKNFHLLFSDTKNFMANEVNRLFIGFILIIIALGYCLHLDLKKSEEQQNIRHQEILQAIERANKKTDFRYFNTTRSLEDIHNVRINTQNGEVKPNQHIIN